MRMENTSAVPSGVPIVKMENDAGCSVFQSASADAIFIGCCSVMILPWMSPVTATRRPDTRSMIAPALAADRNGAAASGSDLSLIMRYMPIPARKAPVVRNAAGMVCRNVITAVLLVRRAMKSVSSARPLTGLTTYPTGCCIQELAARMKYADRTVPVAAIQIVDRWTRFERRPHPKIHRPRNVDSRKKASRPSMASGAPKMSPTNRL